uniref:Golgi apparatus membrane protein TVP23 homolog n=1 Tax=Romanomermis culicivorax TaxID=13658 RepID=A0A915HV71_ROMCU
MTSGSVRLDFSDENIESKQKFKHPYVILAHIAFRSAAVATYLLLFLLSVDFWTVKNITGRLLVGLRWWNFVDSDGKSQWRFESKKGTEHCSSAEANIFWIALVVTPIVWIIFFMTAVIGLQFKWLVCDKPGNYPSKYILIFSAPSGHFLINKTYMNQGDS